MPKPEFNAMDKQALQKLPNLIIPAGTVVAIASRPFMLTEDTPAYGCPENLRHALQWREDNFPHAAPRIMLDSFGSPK